VAVFEEILKDFFSLIKTFNQLKRMYLVFIESFEDKLVKISLKGKGFVSF